MKNSKETRQVFLLRASKLMTIDKLSHSLVYACLCVCVFVWGGWRVSVMGTCASAYRFIHPLKSRPAQAQLQLLQVMLLYLYLYRCTIVSV